MKEKILLGAILILCCTGCAKKEPAVQEFATGPVVVQDEVVKETEPIQDEESTQEAESAQETETSSEAKQSEEKMQYNAFLEKYKNDLSRIRICESEASEFVEDGDVIECKNAVAFEKVYLEKDVVENAKQGDEIEIQGMTYSIDTISENEAGYSVQLTATEENDPQNGKFAYEDIYEFEKASDGEHYIVLFCSDDCVEDSVYTGSVFIAKDAKMNAYVKAEVVDTTFSDYLKDEEFPFLSTWGFEIDAQGLIISIQNQIAG